MRIAFICTGNSARSQMAEALTKAMAKEMGLDVEVYSAGSEPAKEINPYARKVMEELGISLEGQYPKGLEEIPLEKMDLVITLCDHAKQTCPTVPGAKSLHWSLPDPASYEGSSEEKLELFRRLREEIRGRVFELLNQILTKGL